MLLVLAFVKTLFLLLFVLLVGVSCSFAQPPHAKCASISDSLLRIWVPAFDWNAQESDSLIHALEGEAAKTQGTIYTIPIVFHIMVHPHDTAWMGARTNIPDDQIFSQLKVLNEDYRRKAGTRGYNNSAIGADAEIEFCVATIDPQGNNRLGIVRHAWDSTSCFNPSWDYKLKNRWNWPPKKYLNVYVVDSLTYGIGYTNPASSVAGTVSDGVVLARRAFGSKDHPSPLYGNYQLYPDYDLARTLTHEIGHYLNLQHPWNDTGIGSNCADKDGCSDTPPCDGQYFSGGGNQPCTAPIQCNGNQRLIADYMDYSADKCMNIFTSCQATRMRTFLLAKRSTLFSASNLAATGCVTPSVGIEVNHQPLLLEVNAFPNPFSSSLHISISTITNDPLEAMLYDMQGKAFQTMKLAPGIQTMEMPTNALAAGMYVLKAVCGTRCAIVSLVKP